MLNWNQCRNILCIRADNMGDLIMSTPALRALKETFGCKITVLTSKMGSIITPFIKEIDETIVADVPWVKTETINLSEDLSAVIDKLKRCNFDAAIIFTVYSQNPLPAAMVAFMADIPKRIAYCRENPYQLLTDWIPEKEPFEFIEHQVKRDLRLVEFIGASTNNDCLSVQFKDDEKQSAITKLNNAGINISGNDWIVFHPGVSEEKRKYPVAYWVELGKLIAKQLKKKILITGTSAEKEIAGIISKRIGEGAYNIAGLFTIGEFIALIKDAPLVVSVNTATVHIAAATQTPVIVLYALTNPQHTPWKVLSKVFPFSVKEELKSRNEIINYVNNTHFNKHIDYPSPEEIFNSVTSISKDKKLSYYPEATETLSLQNKSDV